MDYKLLGKTGIKVSELCLGTMTFGTDWNFGSDKEESKRIFDASFNIGFYHGGKLTDDVCCGCLLS